MTAKKLVAVSRCRACSARAAGSALRYTPDQIVRVLPADVTLSGLSGCHWGGGGGIKRLDVPLPKGS